MNALDRYLPPETTVSTHRRAIAATPERVWAGLRTLDLRGSPLMRLLLTLRGLKGARTLEDFEAMGFRILTERPPEQIVLGLIGSFWTPRGDLIDFSAEEFTTFDSPGYAKAVWGFELVALGQDRTLVTTQTRMHGTDPASSRAFRRYWRLVGPFSGLIRMEMLRLLRNESEQPSGAPR